MRYNPDAAHYKIVWPVGIPYVVQDDDSALKHALAFRPKDYHGGEYDKEAWLDYLDQKNLVKIQAQWPNMIVTLVGRDQFHFDKKAD